MKAKDLAEFLLSYGDKEVRCRLFHWFSEDFNSGFEEEIEGNTLKDISEESDGEESFIVLEFE